jgi:hypothetical protein
MAAEIQIGGVATDRVFIGTDFTRDFHVKDIDTDSTGATAKEVTGWAVSIDIRRAHPSDEVVYTKALTIIGTFNSVAASNTQRLRWTALDTELTTDAFGNAGGTFYYSVKRTDADVETILQFGKIIVQRVTLT